MKGALQRDRSDHNYSTKLPGVFTGRGILFPPRHARPFTTYNYDVQFRLILVQISSMYLDVLCCTKVRIQCFIAGINLNVRPGDGSVLSFRKR